MNHPQQKSDCPGNVDTFAFFKFTSFQQTWRCKHCLVYGLIDQSGDPNTMTVEGTMTPEDLRFIREMD